ncbi:hypothetical protein PIB30_089284 [Stylosanthes scabra]|uniref:Uncharacterized protein n=1 Tax=Stylosanthes scabra TaxID=79078 RepID=A0ABU6QTW0_9FABA|nr:hypothetical protein [Stylosanthes scabra]
MGGTIPTHLPSSTILLTNHAYASILMHMRGTLIKPHFIYLSQPNQPTPRITPPNPRICVELFLLTSNTSVTHNQTTISNLSPRICVLLYAYAWPSFPTSPYTALFPRICVQLYAYAWKHLPAPRLSAHIGHVHA